MQELVLSNKHGLLGFYAYGDYSIEKISDLNNKVGYEMASKTNIKRLIKNISSNPKRIKNICFSGNDINFMIDDLKITLKNKEDFMNDPDFSYIFEIIRSKNYKISKSSLATKLVVGSFAIALIASISSVAYANHNIQNEVITSDYDNKTSSASYVDDEYDVQLDEIVVNETTNDEEIINNEAVATTNTNTNSSFDGLSSKEETISNIEEANIEPSLALINVKNETESSKAQKTKNLYYDIIEKYANMYNIDPDVMCAIATQERGVHSNEVDSGGAIGLMQVQVSVWNNQNLTVYNYETNSKETIYITLDKLSDVDFNIKTGCAIFQTYLKQMDGNVIAAVQAYNTGCGNVNKIINNYANVVGKTREEILANNDLGWLDYRNSSYPGDPDYVEHVARYYNNDYKDLSVKSR